MNLQKVVWMRALTSWHLYLAVAGGSQVETHTAGLTEGTGRGLGVTTWAYQLILLISSKVQLTLKGGSELLLFEGEPHGGTILW